MVERTIYQRAHVQASAGLAARTLCRVLLGVVAATVLLVVLLGDPAARADAISAPIAVHRLSGDVYEYDYIIPTGSGIYDHVGVHRVVQVTDGRPIASPNGVFLVHGDAWDFDAAFVGGTTPNQSVAVYLASRGVDVWGIDLGWTLVPSSTTDFSFMAHWGLQREINEVETALAFARTVRTLSGSSADKLTLMAWSRGGWIGYALLNEESQRPDSLRQVRAFIPVDNYFKVDDTTVRSNDCSFEQGVQSDIDNGIYAYSNAAVNQLGSLAQSAPDDPSSLFGTPYTNLQASLTYGAAVFELGGLLTPYYHYVGGVFPNENINNIPTDLAYTDVSRWNSFLESASPFETSTLIRDTYAITCSPGPNGPFDDHLNDITVPVLYVGAGGGFGRYGLYSLTLLGSKDVSTHIVSFYPPAQAAFDFGHVDLFYARNAQALVWTAIYNWLVVHAPGRPAGAAHDPAFRSPPMMRVGTMKDLDAGPARVRDADSGFQTLATEIARRGKSLKPDDSSAGRIAAAVRMVAARSLRPFRSSAARARTLVLSAASGGRAAGTS